MPKEEIYCGLDIGSGRVTGVVGRCDFETEKIEILDGKQVIDKEAFTSGVIKDVEKASEVISELVGELETSAKTNRVKIIVGVRGRFVNTYNTHAQIPITSSDRTITVEDQEKVIEHAIKSLRLSAEREIIDVIPQNYIIDGQPGIKNPVGMEGGMLEVDAHAVIAYSSFLRNIERVLHNANYTLERVVYGLISVGELVTELEERKLGSLLIDFNGQTIGTIIYSDGNIKHTQEFFSNDIDIGSDLITREICAYYKTTWNVAENFKKQYCAAKPSSIKKDEQIQIPSRDGKSMKITTKKELSKIAAEVLEALFLDRVIPELKNTKLLEPVLQSGDIVIVGGGANLHGITETIAELFNHECGTDTEARVGTIGIENNIEGSEEIISDFSYTTAISLIKYQLTHLRRKTYFTGRPKKGMFNFIKKIWNFFE